MEQSKTTDQKKTIAAALCSLLCVFLLCMAPARAWADDIGPADVLDINKQSIVGRPVDINTLKQGIYIDFHNTIGAETNSVWNVYIDGVYPSNVVFDGAYGHGFWMVFIPGSSLNFSPNSTHTVSANVTFDGVTYSKNFTFSVTGHEETGTGNNGAGSTDVDSGSSGGGGAGVDGSSNANQEADSSTPSSPDSSSAAQTPSDGADSTLAEEGAASDNPSTAKQINTANGEESGNTTSVSDFIEGGAGNDASTLLAATGAASAFSQPSSLLTGAQLIEMGNVFSLSGAMKHEESDELEEEESNVIDLELFGFPLLFLMMVILLVGALPAGVLKRAGVFVFGSTGFAASRLRA